MRLTSTLFVLVLAPNFASAQQPTANAYVPPSGFVPDSATAVRVAVAVWTPIYGDGDVILKHPVSATLSDGVWTVTGSVPGGLLQANSQLLMIRDVLLVRYGDVYDVPRSAPIETAVVKIDKRDGRILYQGHS